MTDTPETPPVSYSMSPSLVSVLHQLNQSLVMTSYQSGKLYLIGRNPQGGLVVDERMFGRAMGIAVDDQRLVLASGTALHDMRSSLPEGKSVNNIYDACYITRTSMVTGAVDAHDVGLDPDGAPIFVATKWNCLAQTSPTHSFRPIWKPPFISALVPEDRCHMNGLAMQDGTPAYVSAVSRSDTIDGWRDRRKDGGVIVDVASGDIVTTGLSMPHSPRLHRGQLYVLNSGTGELLRIDRETGEQTAICFCPGFVRGLGFCGDFALIGLSRPRYARFEGLALDDKLRAADSEPWTGLQIVDLTSGTVAAWFRIDGPAVTEVYDAAFVPNVRCGMSLAPQAKELADFVIPEPLAP